MPVPFPSPSETNTERPTAQESRLTLAGVLSADLATRDRSFRTRMMHMMALSAPVLRPAPPGVTARVRAYSAELGIDDSLLAMVVSLFETGQLAEGAGLFEAYPDQLSIDGMGERLGDAMRRGALTHGLGGAPDVDFMQVDWFALAHRPVDEVRALFGVVEKSPAAVAAGSVTPWERGGISPAQVAMGQARAARLGRAWSSHGASVAD